MKRMPHLSFVTVALFAFLAACVADNKTHPDHSAYDAGAPAPLDCLPNLDGKIDSAEVKAVLGVPVKYLVSPVGKDRTVDVVGAVDSAGRRSWKMDVDLADDQAITVSASSVDGKWYATSFPGAQFVAPFDAAARLEAVYAQDATALFLLGLASKDPSPTEGKTLLVYATPISVFRFPLAPGKTWTSSSAVSNATVRGLPYAGTDTYEVTDDATGALDLIDLKFTQAHRIRTKVTTAPSAGANVVTQQVSFVFECFGEVARATSKQGEPNADFTMAAEVRRFGL